VVNALCQSLSRVCAAAVFGAGVMFVVEVIGLRGSLHFDEATKLNHARVLFPLYYQVAGGGLSAAIILGLLGRFGGRRGVAYLALLGLGWMILAADYEWVYRPLAAMLARPSLPDNFRQLHTLSRWTNTAVMACSLAAAVIGCWPRALKPEASLPPQ
jgi:hypothetical protein